LLARGDPAGYDKRVATIWSLAFTQLQEHGPAAADLLLLACCAADDAIMALRGYSLISSPAGGVVTVHRLVQAITVAQISDQHAAAWQRVTAALITAAVPEDCQQPANWPTCGALLPHARAALPLSSAPMLSMADYLGWSGSHAAAQDLSQQILDACQQKLGAEHPTP
jgi:hypothetical protein